MEKVKIDDVLKYEQPTKYIVETENYDDSYNTPVLTAGKSFLLGYTNEEKGVFNEVPVIIFDDFTTSFHFVDFPFKVKSSALKILKAVKDKADIKYLYYKMQTIKFEAEQHKRYWISKYSQIEIPLPNLATQQRIAAILDQADAIIQNNRAIVQKYDALTQSLFLDMFGDPVKNEKGWEMKFLGDLCDVGSSRRVFVDELVENGIPFYRGTEIGQMSIEDNITPTLFITEEHYEKLKKETGVPKIGDLLMPSICPDGRIFEVTNDKPFYFKDGRVLWIKVNDGIINSVYLKKYLKAIFAIDYGKIASGTTFAELKIFALKKINLHYPPIQLQNLFAERVAMIEAQKQQAQLELAKSEELFNSLLQRAFKGELS